MVTQDAPTTSPRVPSIMTIDLGISYFNYGSVVVVKATVQKAQ